MKDVIRVKPVIEQSAVLQRILVGLDEPLQGLMPFGVHSNAHQ